MVDLMLQKRHHRQAGQVLKLQVEPLKLISITEPELKADPEVADGEEVVQHPSQRFCIAYDNTMGTFYILQPSRKPKPQGALWYSLEDLPAVAENSMRKPHFSTANLVLTCLPQCASLKQSNILGKENGISSSKAYIRPA
jgi:hypothetical protein